MIFYIKPRHGITARLAKTAEKTPGRVKAVTLEGPYGGPDTDFDRFGTILVVAGGSGGGFSLGIVEAALRLNSDGKRRVQVVYSTKDPVGAEWYSQSLDAVCSTIPDAGVEGMSRSLHVTGSAAGIGSEEFEDVEKVPEAGPSRNDHTSRPDIPSIIGSCLQSAAVVEDRGRRIGIFVCGPASMIHDARVATANAQRDVLRGLVDEVYLHAESFS